MIFFASRSFLISSSLAFCSGVALQMIMSEDCGPIARPNGLNSGFQVPATTCSMAYSTWKPTPVTE